MTGKNTKAQRRQRYTKMPSAGPKPKESHPPELYARDLQLPSLPPFTDQPLKIFPMERNVL